MTLTCSMMITSRINCVPFIQTFWLPSMPLLVIDNFACKKLIRWILNKFLAIFRHFGYENDAEQWHKALCKLFCQLIWLSDLPSRMNIDGLDDFTVLQDQFRTKVLQHQISQQLSRKSASSVTEKTVSCRNCKLPHNVSDCKKNCTYSTCANSPPHPAKDCINLK